MKTLTLQEAIEIAPAIGSDRAGSNTSKSYQFVSTRKILEHVSEHGWKITGAQAQGSSLFAQHHVTLIHERDLALVESSENQEGVLRMELFNSHNKKKRLLLGIGFFRFVCSNGLIVASGPAETIRTVHRFSDNRMDAIQDQINQLTDRFPHIQNTINDFKSRVLSEQEQDSFSEFALRGRYHYRKTLPKRFIQTRDQSQKLLMPRRPEDQGDSTWSVFNRVQENIIRGIEGSSRPLRGYGDSIRVNQLLWKGAETALQYENDDFHKELFKIIDKKQKTKITIQEN